MLVTLNTDASFDSNTGIAAFAMWAACDLGRIKFSKVLRDKCKNSDEAEMKAIINAIHIVCDRIPSVSHIIINTDSLHSIAVFKNDKHHQRKYMGGSKKFSIYRCELNKVVAKFKKSVNIELRHVKAHTDNTDVRSFVNQWCDDNAKEKMRLARLLTTI